MPQDFVFGEFRLSPARRVLKRGGVEVALVPRYLDLLLMLVRRRDEAVSRREILDTVWDDVVVSDGALSQAVRTLRRALDDDSRDPRFIRTVSRHGYRFVHAVEVEEADAVSGDAHWEVLADPARSPAERRSAAETLLQSGAAAGLERLDSRSVPADARALLRDSRWDVPGAREVPIFGRPMAMRTLALLFAWRLRRVRRVAGKRFAAALGGAVVAGSLAGFVGGLALYLGPGSEATAAVLLLLPLVGMIIAAVGASGVAAGLCCAEVLVRSHRGLALVLFGALGGGLVGFVAHAIGSIALAGLFGQDLSPAAGGLEGLVLGGATGLGYAMGTPRPQGGMATPHGRARLASVLLAGVTCAAAGALLTATGSYLGAMSLDLLAHGFPGSQVGLDPLARLLGEARPGPATKIAIGAWEGLMFASGTVFGLTRRPK